MASEIQSGERARALRSQSAVGVVSLASCVEASPLQAGCSALRALSGCHVETSPVALERQGDFAGTPTSRAAALVEMWNRDDVDAILCARGGYGSNYLLPLLDFAALAASPKAFVGYSDNTSLLIALDCAGLVTFHGPMVASDFAIGREDEPSFLAALRGDALDFSFPAGSNHAGASITGSRVQPLVVGEVCAPITGGCLSIIVAALGTPWEIQTFGKILFLEDVNEKPYRIDRMLMHLLLAGKFDGVRGIIFGAMLGCYPASAEEETLTQMIRRVLGGLGVPIVLGFPSGHVEFGNITLPFGVPATLHSSDTGVRLQVEPSTLVFIP